MVNFVKTLSCKDADFDCDYVVKDETEEEILNIGKHNGYYGMKEWIYREETNKLYPYTLINFNYIHPLDLEQK